MIKGNLELVIEAFTWIYSILNYIVHFRPMNLIEITIGFFRKLLILVCEPVLVYESILVYKPVLVYELTLISDYILWYYIIFSILVWLS